MPESVVFREDANLIEVQSFGEVSSDDLKTTIQEILRLAVEHDVSRVLIHGAAQEKMPNLKELFFFHREIPKGVRFAATVSEPIKGKADFLETVALNRGIQFRFFNSLEDAHQWLGS